MQNSSVTYTGFAAWTSPIDEEDTSKQKLPSFSMFGSSMPPILPEVCGILTYPNNDKLKRKRFVGQVGEGMRSGVGVMEYADGSSYAGEWSDDDLNGSGVQARNSRAIWAFRA
jgi:hypothetical protein